jgi:hypothetical protein
MGTLGIHLDPTLSQADQLLQIQSSDSEDDGNDDDDDDIDSDVGGTVSLTFPLTSHEGQLR